jgi:hypothetical protein
MRIDITDFARRNWQPEKGARRIVGISPEELVGRANEAAAAGAALAEGYAPFCRHLFVENPGPTRCGFAPITAETRGHLRSGYVSRRDGELAVLERWFEGIEPPRALWLDLILYSHAQLLAEAADYSARHGAAEPVPDCDWGIVGVIGTLEPEEPPMPPITQMRNALGRAEGGSGVPIDPEAYARAVAFWERHAAIG